MMGVTKVAMGWSGPIITLAIILLVVILIIFFIRWRRRR